RRTAIALLLRLVLIGWKHAPRAALSWRLLGSATRLLPERALLLAIHLPGWSSHLRSAESGRLVRTAQQNIRPVGHRIIDELPLVVFLLLVVNANGGIFAQAGDADNRATAKRLIASLSKDPTIRIYNK